MLFQVKKMTMTSALLSFLVVEIHGLRSDNGGTRKVFSFGEYNYDDTGEYISECQVTESYPIDVQAPSPQVI